MKKIFLLLLVIFIIHPSYAGGIGYVDYNKIIKNYNFAKAAIHELDKKSAEIQYFLQSKEEEFSSLESPVQKKKFEEEVQAEIAKRENAFNDFKSKRENLINTKARAAIEKVRIDNNLDAVIDAANVYSGGVDITEKVIFYLNN